MKLWQIVWHKCKFAHFKYAVACLEFSVGVELDNDGFGLKGNYTKVRFAA